MKHILPILFLFFVVFSFPKNANAAISLGNTPSSINIDQEFTIDVDLTCSGCGVSYLRGVFFYPDASTSYSGYTKNNTGDWINLPGSSATSYFKVESGSWTGQMNFKFDSVKPPGDYYFKVGRYTANSSSFTVSNSVLVTIIMPSLSPSLSPDPTVSPSVTETPTATATLTQTPIPTPTKAIYTINKPKDQDGQTISNVEIYVDSLYTHHLDNEVLEFCNGCFCDTAKTIPCGFGEHTIKLTKSGYADWSEQRTINQGQNYETTPILTKLSESTPTPTSTSTPTPAPRSPQGEVGKTPTPTITPRSPQGEVGATISAVLGESTNSASISSEYVASQEPTPSPENIIKKKINYKNTFFIGLLISVSSGAMLYFRFRKD